MGQSQCHERHSSFRPIKDPAHGHRSFQGFNDFCHPNWSETTAQFYDLRAIFNGLLGHFYDFCLMPRIDADRCVSDRVSFDYGTVHLGIEARRRKDDRKIIELRIHLL